MAVTSMANSSIVNFQKFRSIAKAAFANGFPTQYVVVAGGGGGGEGVGSGGGAGGYRSNVSGENTGGGLSAETALTLSTGVYTVTVGAGGAGSQPPSSGNNSVFGQITSLAGGSAGNGDVPGTPPANGGSGGGARNLGVTATGANGTIGQGFDGGDLTNAGTSGNRCSGGGGGGGAVGGDGTNLTSGAGGAGVASSITGSSVTRAGGGGGGSSGTVSAGAAGSGGGGAGANASDAGGNGDANSGGGGGGTSVGTIGAGGSGVVIFSLPAQAIVEFSAGVTQTSAIAGANRVYTVTATSTTSETVTIL